MEGEHGDGLSKRLRKKKSKPGSDNSQPECVDSEVNGHGSHSQQEKATSADGDQKDTNHRTSGRRRKSSLTDGCQICPVCGITVRPAELEQHFQYEVQQIDQIIRRGRIVKDTQSSYALSKAKEARENENGHGKRPRKRRRRRKDSDSTDSSSDSDSESSEDIDPRLVLLEVRGNRHARERKKELMQNPELNPETMLCPICFQPLIGEGLVCS